MTIKALTDLRDAVREGELDPFQIEAMAMNAFAYFDAPDRWKCAACSGGSYHGSLDAAKQLHEAVLPGWEFGYDGSIAWVKQPDLRTSYRHDSRGGYTARAWLLAILEALIQEGGGDDQ